MTARIIKSTVSSVFYYSGALFLMDRVLMPDKGITILAYHRITDGQSPISGLSMDVAHFERQIRYISQRYTLLTLDESVKILSSGGTLPANSIVVTFDDGFRDNYISAFPVLEKYGVRATIFLSVEAVDSGHALWFDSVSEVLRTTAKKHVTLELKGGRNYDLNTSEQKNAALAEILSYMKYLNKNERDIFIAGLYDKLGFDLNNRGKGEMVTWEEVRKMNNAGISFGSHGMSHTILSCLAGDELEYEIGQSKRIIGERTGIDVRMFAYPNGCDGDFDFRAYKVFEKYSYDAACTLIKGKNDTTVPRYALRRLCMSTGMSAGVSGKFSGTVFSAELSGIYRRMGIK